MRKHFMTKGKMKSFSFWNERFAITNTRNVIRTNAGQKDNVAQHTNERWTAFSVIIFVILHAKRTKQHLKHI